MTLGDPIQTTLWAEVAEQRAELSRRAAELDAMTDEEKDQRLVPLDRILEELETKPERPN